MRRVLLLSCVMAAAGAAVVTGCADHDGGDPARQAPHTRPRALTWQQELRIADAQQRLTRQCMNRKGFGYWEDRTLTLQESRPVRYVQDDVAWARTHGYGGRISAKETRLHEHNPNATYRRSLSPSRRTAFDTALDGGDNARMLTASLPNGERIQKLVGGCTEEAERTLYGDPAVWFRTSKTATGLNLLYGTELMADRELTAATGAWSRCMKQAGQHYKDPQAARDAVRTRTSRLGAARADEAFTVERKTAVADAACARETSLRTVATAREAHYIDRLRGRFGKDIDTYHRLGRQAYDRAVRIVPERD
ncbi:hypothetical protein ACIBAI_00370 [Streptomyces sp. NPDC051041]|uniref:hypothetical protein n=1 Tax=Streptomyces sp. NPDC051041 TaxID=3365640 RepID=UPI003788EC5B